MEAFIHRAIKENYVSLYLYFTSCTTWFYPHGEDDDDESKLYPFLYIGWEVRVTKRNKQTNSRSYKYVYITRRDAFGLWKPLSYETESPLEIIIK